MLTSPKKPGLTTSIDLVVAAIHDVHLFHPNTPTEYVLDSLRQLFPDNATTGDIDIIFIAGDLFDRPLPFPDDNVSAVNFWFTAFLQMCARRDIIVRILEGTPSHDWKQSKKLVELAALAEIPVDVKYVSDLSIEHIAKLGVNVLYVPDEWRPRCDDTWEEVTQLLKQHGLEQVDFTVMHGAFHHQMPKNIHHQLELHVAERYLSITKRHIFIGHVHQMSVYDRILAGGSPERLSHGDEAQKGHFKVTYRAEDDYTVEFVVNKRAMRYDTLDCVGLGSEEFQTLIRERVASFPSQGHIRLKAKKHDVAMAAIPTLESAYPHIHWTTKEVKSSADEEKPVLIDGRVKFKGLTITSDNISELLRERLAAKLNPKQLDRCLTVLEGVVNG